MDNNNNYEWAKPIYVEEQKGTVAKKFFASVFLWMFIALGLSTLSAFFMASSPTLLNYLVRFDEAGNRAGMTTLGYVAMFAPLGLVMLMSAGISKLSYTTLLGVFVAYALLTGVSLSFILLIYTSASIISCFAAAAGIFGIMAVLGYTTDTDLTKYSSILMVGLIGLVIATVINMFIGSATMDYILSFFGVAIFTALTAYDVQKLKLIGEGIEQNGDQIAQADSKKLAIMGALSLYLDFLNIFLYLLRIFGNRR
jgi:FtsH-binding integral membrane protein